MSLLQDGERVMQKNEGGWDFSLEESADGRAIQLDIAVGRFLDTSLIKADVQPNHVRLLIKAWQLLFCLLARPCACAVDGGTPATSCGFPNCRGICCSCSCPKRSGQTRALHKDQQPLGACC